MKYGIIAWVILIIVAAAVIIYNRILRKRIMESGIETQGEISRIEENYDDDTGSTTYCRYVRYLDENKTEREAMLHGANRLDVGDKVTIKYHPSNYAYAELICSVKTVI